MSVGSDSAVLDLYVLVLVHWFALICCVGVHTFFVNLGFLSIHAFCDISQTPPAAPRRSAWSEMMVAMHENYKS